MQTQEYSYFQSGNLKLAYSVIGGGIPICVCPVSWGVSNHKWSGFFELAKFYKLIFLEPRGIENSEIGKSKTEFSINQLVQDLDSLKKFLKIKTWHLIGQSAGGFTALKYSLTFPEKVLSQTIVCSAPTGHFQRGTIRDTNHPRYAEVKTAAQLFRTNFTKETFRQFMLKVYVMDAQTEKSKKEILKVFSETDISISRYKYFATKELNDYNLVPLLKKINIPTLVISGKHDLHVLPFHSKTIANNIPNAKYVEFEKSGHFPLLDEPQKFISTVKNFLEN